MAILWWFNESHCCNGGGLAPQVVSGAVIANPLTTAITLDIDLAAIAMCIGVACDADVGPRNWRDVPLTFGLSGPSSALSLHLRRRSAPSQR